MVFGQMNEPAGVRLRVALTGLTMAEYFRDEGRDVLLFIDNIFRFVMSGSEVSALLGRMPSAVGYQPTLATEMGDCRSASPRPRRARSHRCRPCTCRQTTTPIRRRWPRLRTWTRPSPGTLDRGKRHLPGCRPACVDLRLLDPLHRRRRSLPHRARSAARLAALQRPAGHHRHSWRGRTERRRQDPGRPRPQDGALLLASRCSWPRPLPVSRANMSR